MNEIEAYILGVVAVSLMCGIINSVLGKTGTATYLVKLFTGLFLALTAIRPALGVSILEIERYLNSVNIESESVATAGENVAHDELRAIIKTRTEAYILNKADLLGVDIQVQVTVGTEMPPVPDGVVLSGAVSPYAKARLSTILEEELGIRKEAQQWTG